MTPRRPYFLRPPPISNIKLAHYPLGDMRKEKRDPVREFLAKVGSKGGRTTVKKYGRGQMKAWGKLGGRPPKKR